MTEQSSENLPLLWGVWLPRKGWLRGNESRALMFEYKVIANETAKRLGSHARVYFIDQSLVDIEEKLLAAERSEFFYPFFMFDIRRLAKFFQGKEQGR